MVFPSLQSSFFIPRYKPFSVIIHNLDVVRISFAPFKTDSELVIDSDAVLAGSVVAKFLELIPRGGLQILELSRCVQHLQLTQCHAPEIGWRHSFALAGAPKRLRTFVRETLDHGTIITHNVINVKRYYSMPLTCPARLRHGRRNDETTCPPRGCVCLNRKTALGL